MTCRNWRKYWVSLRIYFMYLYYCKGIAHTECLIIMVGDLALHSEGRGHSTSRWWESPHEGLWKSKQKYKKKIPPDSLFVSGVYSWYSPCHNNINSWMMAIVLRFNHFIVVSSKCKNDYESLTWVLEETITSQQQELFAF